MTAWQQSSKTSAGTIAAEFEPSRWVAATTLLMLGCAVVAVLISGLAWPWRIVLAAGGLAYGLYSVHRFMTPSFDAVGFDGVQWLLGDVRGRRHIAEVHVWRLLGPFLVIDFRCQDRQRFVCLLAPDNCTAAQRRQWLLALARSGAG